MRTITKFFCIVFLWCYVCSAVYAGNVYYIGNSSKYEYLPTDFPSVPVGGDTIKILADRTGRLRFNYLVGQKDNPIVIINSGGKVRMKGVATYNAMTFSNCTNIKLSGRGDATNHYGFRLVGPPFGLSFENFSSGCEAEFIEIDSCSLGVHAKRDYGGNPPIPYPEFNYLAVHDCFVNHCSESFYIGETKAPGMLFKHVRLYNNVIMNSGRESFQIGNCVDDIEAYNNFCYYAGKDSTYAQENNSQFGVNSVGKFYNNIFIKAPSFGVIMLGNGDMYVRNNYFEDNQGIFIDDKYSPIQSSPIKIENNFFKGTKVDPYVVRSLNYYSEYYLNNNKYDVCSSFLVNGFPTIIENKNNVKTTINQLKYTLENGVFHLDPNGPEEYRGMGPIQGLSHVFNYTPVLNNIPDIVVNVGDTLDIPLDAHTEDGDSIIFRAKNLPSFATIIHKSKEHAILHIDGRNHSKAVFTTLMMASDASHEAIARQYVKIALKAVDNHPTTLVLPPTATVEAATKVRLNVSAYDADRDTVHYTITGLPRFAKFSSTLDSAILYIKPTNVDPGDYKIVIKAEDGYSTPALDTILLKVTPAVMREGRVVYRVNCGGVEQEDFPINWQNDKETNTPQVYVANNSKTTGADLWSGTNTTGAPNNLFGSFRYNGVGLQDMKFEYPCENGRYRVNLFFAERYAEVNSGVTETFGIYLKDSLMQDSVNLYAEAGYKAVKKSFEVDVRDNKIGLKLRKLINNSKLNGVEIIYLHAINMPPVIGDIANQTMYEGDTLTITPSVTDDAFGGSDSLSLTAPGIPPFISLVKSGSNYRVRIEPNYESSGTYTIPLIASDGVFQVTKTFNLTVKDFHFNPPVFSSINKSQITEGRKDTISISFTDPDNDAITLSATQLPSFAQFVDLYNGTGRIILTPGYSDAGNYSILVKAQDTFGFSITDTVQLNVLKGYEVVRIPLNSSMITNLVVGGNVNNTPALLVDEQNLDPTRNQNPVGAYWNPATKTSILPFTFYIDLGQYYALKKLYLFDVENVGTMNVYYGSPGNWTSLYSLSTNTYRCWRLNNVDVSTRYLFFSTSTSAYISEIAAYGYLDPNQGVTNILKSAVAPLDGGFEGAELSADNSVAWIYLDRVSSELHITAKEKNVIVDIRSISGQSVLHSIEKLINVSALARGVYIVNVRSLNGDELVRDKIMKN